MPQSSTETTAGQGPWLVIQPEINNACVREARSTVNREVVEWKAAGRESVVVSLPLALAAEGLLRVLKDLLGASEAAEAGRRDESWMIDSMDDARTQIAAAEGTAP